ncbi:interleukin-1 receptor-associated kinase 1 [Discoglossus pictus]
MSTCSVEELFLYSVPAPVMFRFYEIMDSLDDSDWGKFASRIIHNLTSLRLLEQQNQRSRTQGVMWSWMNRNARVGDLLNILRSLGLLRALDVFQTWSREYSSGAVAPHPHPPRRDSLPPPYPHPGPAMEPQCQEEKPPCQQSTQTTKSSASPLPLPGPPPPPQSLIQSSFCSSHKFSSGASSDSGSSKIHSSVQDSFTPSYFAEAPRPLEWSFQEVVKGTNNFSQSLLIGEGGFGCVYKATMRHTQYAVKRLKQDSDLEWSTVKKSFLTEIEKLTCLRHPNIVDLAGYCTEGEECCLIYLYLPNGSLEDRLHSQGSSPPLSWQQRVSILQGAACGIQFLHSWQPCIIHGDIKSSNILLDQALAPKLGDFGLARFSRYSRDAGKSRTIAQTTTVRGTLAYLPDEYVKMGKLSLELDTYSFGVVLLENLTGRKAIEDNESKSHSVYLKDLVQKEKSCVVEDSTVGKGKQNILPRLASRICHQHLDRQAGYCSEEVAQQLCLLACRCLERQKKRPSMEEVFNILKKLQELLSVSARGEDHGTSLPQPSIASQKLHFPEKLDHVPSSLLIPEENTYKFTPCGNPLELSNKGSLQTYSTSISLYDDKLDSFCSISSCGKSLRTFQGSPKVPVESDESVPDSCLAAMSQEFKDLSVRSPESHQEGSTSLGAVLQSLYPAAQLQPLNAPARLINYCSSSAEGGSSETSDSQVILPHHQIVMNPAKQRLVEQVALYEQGKINSLEFFSSGISPGQHFEVRGYPEESDDFPS